MSGMLPPPAPGADARDEDPLLGAALRSGADEVLDELARRAGAGGTARSLAVRLAGGAELPGRVTRPGAALSAAGALATAWFALGRDEVEQRAAVELFRQAVEAGGPKALRQAERRHYLQAAFLTGRHDLVRTGLDTLQGVHPDVVEGLRADLVNPYAEGTQQPASHARWEKLLGSRFAARDLDGPRVDGARDPVFDGLRLPATRSVDGPMVTVVVPAFRPDRGLVTSVRSVLDQSWGNLELLLVDDCSEPGHAELLEECAALDDRVRLLRQAVNGGSYLARNAALAVARGAYVTTQDADDWSHPERLALQVAALEEAPEAAASRSVAIRARPDLTRQWFGYRPERMNASSLLVRREVLEAVGGFDAIRKGADSEMQERLGLVGGVVNVTEPLAITRLAAGSLSRADFAFGRHSPDRVLFRSSFRVWHAGLRAAGASAPADVRLERDGMRPFPVPRSFVRDLAGRPVPRSDYRMVLVVDQARPPVEVLEGLVEAGPRSDGTGAADRAPVTGAEGPTVAVLGREDLTRSGMMSPDWSPVLLEAARDGVVDLVTDTDQVRADVVVVLEPAALAPAARPMPSVTTDRVLLAAVPPSEVEPVRDLEGAAATVRSHWGVRAEWVARTPAEQQAWAADGWELPLVTDLLGAGAAGVSLRG
ncbi:glycosyl transferase family 2 [Ornithinimicrobium humiphilum]|uniref:Glycosyl transferase family 2 n=2 Tax=Ornithinimicrobium humiphilum TaxID=125288 RepID=A0A543KK19_9MICO|nr:glycosyl transferase family 2 [Ornithinimicrobium humiphilum]